ncbi:MAG: protein kinase [Polyangiaceae bacterium]|nr:protein kinase [Polyangiaceae bacterium]
MRTGYLAIRRLMEEKAKVGMLPGSAVARYNEKIDDALRFVAEVHEADCIADPKDRARALESLGDDIERRNQAMIFSGVANQALPINRQIGGRWFDESRLGAGGPRSHRRASDHAVNAPASFQVPGSLRPGAVLAGRYVIEATLGAGGFGQVYRARQEPLGRLVAVKVLLAKTASLSPGQSERFKREAHLAMRLEHPNTVRVLDIGVTDGGLPFIIWGCYAA